MNLAVNWQSRKLAYCPSPYERIAVISPTHFKAWLVMRMWDFNFQEVWRVTGMLLKIKRPEGRIDTFEKDDEKQPRVSGDILENKVVRCGRPKPLKIISN